MVEDDYSSMGKQGIIGKVDIPQPLFPVCVCHVNNLWEWKKYNGPNKRPINGIRLQYQPQLSILTHTKVHASLWVSEKDWTAFEFWKRSVLFCKHRAAYDRIRTKAEKVIWNSMQSWQHTLSPLANVSGSGWSVWPVEALCLPTGRDEGLH